MPIDFLIIFLVINILLVPKLWKNKKQFLYYVAFLAIASCVLQPVFLAFVIPMAIFFLPQFIKKKKWLSLYSIFSIALILYLYYWHVYTISQPDFNGSFADGLVLGWVYMVFISCLLGVIIKLITLYFEYKNYNPKFIYAVITFGFLLIPLFVFFPSYFIKYLIR